ncbi:MAG: thymidylate kinase [Anaerolineae bacterium]|nr:thymidylate kinase [Anaerolineae bacterium]
MAVKQFYGKGLPNVDPALLKGKLIVLEGSDGSGRSTQLAMLRDWLQRMGYATEEVGLRRSLLIAKEIEEAKQGNTMGPTTLALFYATDFADQMENKIIPALRAGFIVLADRYIYTLMARALVRGASLEWLRELYSIALVPDAVFYLQVPPEMLAERNFRKTGVLDYWESGMDIRRAGDMYECFIGYQHQLQEQFRVLQGIYNFETIRGNRLPRTISIELRAKVEQILQIEPVRPVQPVLESMVAA